MDFTTVKDDILKVIKTGNKYAYNYGIGTQDEFEVISIKSNEVHIDSKGLLRDGVKSPNLIIRNKNDEKFPFSFLIRDEEGNVEDLAIMSVTGPFSTLKEGMLRAGEWIIDNAL